MELKCTLILFGSFLLCSESRECDEGFMKINKTFVFCHNEDEDECATPNLCGDNTRCINTHGSYYCTCDEGFFLVSPSFTSDTGQCVDEDECLSSVCGVHSDCTNTPGSFFCTCYPGFDKLENGTCAGLFLLCSYSRECSVGFKYINKTCVDEDECETQSLCGDNAQCINIPGSYYCTCDEGFRSNTPNFTATTGQCLDINECADPDVCGTNADCLNYPGRYSCKCHQGYSNYGDDQSKCEEMVHFCQ